MTTKPMILVTGATGAQGGSVAKALLAGEKYAVRILTRDTTAENAIALEKAGAEVVYGDFADIESLKAAMKDCYGVFGVTSFWEHFDKEYRLGKNLVDAVKQSGIQHFVFSSLEDYSRLSNRKLPVPHYDMKADLEYYTRSLGIPSTFVQASFYYENFFSFFPLQKDNNGTFSFGFPQGDTKLAMVSAEDYGPIAAAVFSNPDEYTGRVIRAVGADDDCAQYAAILSRVLEQPVTYKYTPHAYYARLGFPGAAELANMFEVQRLYVPNRQADMEECFRLYPGMQRFESWVKKNKEKFLAVMGLSLETAE